MPFISRLWSFHHSNPAALQSPLFLIKSRFINSGLTSSHLKSPAFNFSAALLVQSYHGSCCRPQVNPPQRFSRRTSGANSILPPAKQGNHQDRRVYRDGEDPRYNVDLVTYDKESEECHPAIRCATRSLGHEGYPHRLLIWLFHGSAASGTARHLR